MEPKISLNLSSGGLDRRAFLSGALLGGVGAFSGLEGPSREGVLAELWSVDQVEDWMKKLKAGGGAIGEAPNRAESYWELVRSGFLLEQPYLNCGSLSPSAQNVLVAQVSALLEEAKTPSSHSLALEEKAMNVRQILARSLGAASEDLFFTANTTHGCHIVAEGLNLEAGDEIILTDHEHAVARHGFERRARKDGVKLVFAKLPEAGSETLDSLLESITSKFTERTRVVAVSHIPYDNGYVLPLKEIADVCHERGVFIHVDGAHGPGMLPIHLRTMGVDSYAGNGHKWFMGPKATGFLYIRNAKDVGIDQSFIEQGTSLYNAGTGTRDVVQMIGLGAALEFGDAVGSSVIWARIRELANYTREKFGELPGLRLYSSAHKQVQSGIVTFWIEGAEAKPGRAAELAASCLKAGITLKGLTDFGTPLIRLTPHVYVSKEDIDTAADTLKRLLR